LWFWRKSGDLNGLAATLSGIVTAWSTALVMGKPFKLINKAIERRLQNVLKQMVFIGAFVVCPSGA
jgi:hypothetical protein